MEETYKTLKAKGLDDKGFDEWILKSNVRSTYSQAQLDSLSKLWYSSKLKPKPKKKKPAAKPLDSFKYFNENEQE